MARQKYREVTLVFKQPVYDKVCPECGAKFEGKAIQRRCSRRCTSRANARELRRRRKEEAAEMPREEAVLV